MGQRNNGHSGKKFTQIPESWEKTEPKKVDSLKKEGFDKWAYKLPTFRVKGKRYDKKCNVVRVLSFPETTPSGKLEMIKEYGYSHNLVTDDGEIYYAKKGAGECPSACENFLAGAFEMGSAAVCEMECHDYSDFSAGCGNPIACSIQVYTACYPKTNDTGDADNTGDGVDVVSYAILYTTCSWSDATVEHGVILEDLTPNACTSLLSSFSFCVFAKTTCDTLKVFVNHAFENV
jgi:hypothetical protein